MAVKKIIEPKVNDATMTDIITLINDKFTSSDKYSKLQFDAIQLQLKIVTTDVSILREEVKDISNRLTVIDRQDAVHYLTYPNTILAADLKPIIKEFPKVKDTTDELTFIRKWFKPSLVGTLIGILVTIISIAIVFFKVQPEIDILSAKQKYNEKNVGNVTEEQVKQINSLLHK